MQAPTSKESADSVLAALESRIEGWEKEKHDVLLQIGAYVNALDLSIQRAKADHGKITNARSPISRLPTELLLMIFKVGQLSEFVSLRPRIRFEVLVSHVASGWRSVAINTPSLWTSVCVDSERRFHGVAIYTERSKSYPLDIKYLAYKAADSDQALASFEVLTSHVHRWRRLSLFTCHKVIMDIIGTLHPSTVPLLEHLSLWFDRSHYGTGSGKVPVLAAPLLSFVRLRGPAIEFPLSPSNVKTLHLDWLDVSDGHLYTLLTTSPCLTHLSLLEVTHDLSLSIIEIPTLRSLRLSPLDRFAFEMLSILVAPQLESLLLNGGMLWNQAIDDWIQSQTISTKTRFPNLKSFSFGVAGFSRSQLRRFFDAFLTIEHLTLYRDGCDDITISVLGKASVNTVPWPKLRTITIDDFGSGQRMLCATLQARKELGCPISQLYLHKRSYASLQQCGQIPLLRGVVQVEKRNHPDVWPADLTYQDDIDDFWLD